MNVSKKVTTITIGSILLFWTVVLGLRYQANQDTDNFFNNNLRSYFIRYPLVRKLFHLDFDGDARTDYFGSHFSKIVITVGAAPGVEVPKETIKKAVKRFGEITNKPAEIVWQEETVPLSSSATNEEVRDAVVVYDRYKAQPGEAKLYILLAEGGAEKGTILGETVGATALAIYTEDLKEFTQPYPWTYDKYFLGTLVHEMGHQLGLPHNDMPGCIMNPRAEEGGVPQTLSSTVLTDFCDYELTELENIRKEIK